MPPIPAYVSPTLAAIHARRLADRMVIAADEVESPFIRASKAHHECARAIWMDFHWVTGGEEWSPRMLRLLETGHMHEARILADLEKVEGAIVHRVDPHTGAQFEIDIDGYIQGHMDGVMLGVIEAPKKWHLIECKTANEKSFLAIKKLSVESGKPEHWLQVQLYMLGSGLKRCLYYLINKNTDEEYVERIRLDVPFVERAVNRLIDIAEAPRPPLKFRDDANSPPCIFCRHKGLCHEEAMPRIHCRTCLASKPKPGGNWWCERWQCDLTPAQQAEGCAHHLWIPDLLPLEQVDATDETVIYRLPDGREWIDSGREKGSVT